MALIAKPNTFTAGTTIQSGQVNSNFDTVYNEFNGSISNTNISASAAIVDTKLAQITTASKVSGAALTSLTSVPSGAGILPFANSYYGPAFSVHKNGTNQAGIATGTFTLLTWSTELWDTNANFATNRFTPTVAGKYHISASMTIITLADAKPAAPILYKNGARVYFGGLAPIGAAYSATFMAGWDVSMNGSTDYLELYAYHENGSNRDVDGAAEDTWFSGFMFSS